MRAATILLVCGLAACGRPGEAPTPARFAIRGRWPIAPMDVTFGVEDATSPLPAGTFERVVQRAVAQWSATGAVGFRKAAAGERPDVTFGFRRGHHGACEPFGTGADVAHAGPVGPGSFVHYDLARKWSEDGADGAVSLFATTLHEVGHVLGLGHVDTPDAVMGVDPERPSSLSVHDRAGLHSLYGGGPDHPGDLAVVGTDGVVACVVRGVAPAGRAEFALFDADGDGRHELLVWRTDLSGHGELVLFRFTSGRPLLERSIGPFLGVVVPGARVGFVRGPDGERLLVATAPNGVVMPRQFDRFGVPELPARPVEAGLAARAALVREGDVDGDGRPERVERR
ncbi:MAG: matrixin family metalloprotease, partial [Planctomycetes bacterium]|nr:matrixin family metalloprotease [Planctomycetota bacterium]